MGTDSRRDFLGQVGKAAAGAALVAGGSFAATGTEATAESPPPPTGDAGRARRVVPGSTSPNYSRAIVHGGVAYVSGALGIPPGARAVPSDFAEEVRVALEHLKVGVESAGSKMSQVLKCTCFITEQSQFDAMNQVYRTFFPTDPPARSTVVVKALVFPGARIEIDCIAHL